jgi:hypothetical protein
MAMLNNQMVTKHPKTEKQKHIDPEVGFSFILTFISTFIVAIATV